MINQRERILMFVVAGIVGVYGVFFVIQRALIGPLRAQADRIRNVKLDVQAKQRQFEKMMVASDQLAEWKKISLPSDEGTARSLYQQFLVNLMRDCKMQDASLTPSKTQRIQFTAGRNPRAKSSNAVTFTRFPYEISGKMTIENLTDLLYKFYQPNLLHQIRTAKITRGKDGRMLDVNLTVEALALDSVSDRERLIPEEEATRGALVAGVPRETFSVIASRNIFQPFREPPKQEVRKDPEVDAAKHVLLTGYTFVGDQPEAWLYNRLTNESTVLRPGDQLDLAGVKGKLASITSSGILIEIDEQQWSLGLGKNLREMRSMSNPSLARSPGSESTPTSSGAAPETKSENSETTQPPAGVDTDTQPKPPMEVPQTSEPGKAATAGAPNSPSDSPTHSVKEAVEPKPGS